MNQIAINFDSNTYQGAGKVTFTRMESVSDIAGDDGTQEILLDGKCIGEIRRCMVDVGGATIEYRVGSYDVTFWTVPGLTDQESTNLDREFRVSRRRFDCGAKTARQAHTAAKNYVRETVKKAIAG